MAAVRCCKTQHVILYARARAHLRTQVLQCTGRHRGLRRCNRRTAHRTRLRDCCSAEFSSSHCYVTNLFCPCDPSAMLYIHQATLMEALHQRMQVGPARIAPSEGPRAERICQANHCPKKYHDATDVLAEVGAPIAYAWQSYGLARLHKSVNTPCTTCPLHGSYMG
jgi:hypothetical protein